MGYIEKDNKKHKLLPSERIFKNKKWPTTELIKDKFKVFLKHMFLHNQELGIRK